RLEEQGARVEVHRRVHLARGAARIRERAVLEPHQQDGEGSGGRGEEDHQRAGRRRQARALRLGPGGQAAAAMDREVEPGDALTAETGAAGTVALTDLVKRYGPAGGVE